MTSGKQKSLSILHGNKAPPQSASLHAAVKRLLGRADIADQLALRHGDITMTFGQLGSKVHALCHKLQKVVCPKFQNQDGGSKIQDGGTKDPNQDGGSSTVVACFLPPGFERITAMLACFCAGLAYLPLDESLPENRMELMFTETKATMVLALTENDASDAVKSVCARLGVDIVEVQDVTTPDAADLSKLPEVTEEDNPLVCVLYTSGSTGMPKGVKLRSANIMNRLEWCWRAVPFDKEAIGCHKTSLLFVDSLTEILGCLLKGIPLQIFDSDTVSRVDKFNEDILKYKVTRIVLVPSLLKAMLDIVEMNHTETLSTLKFVVCSGEALSAELASKFFRIVPTAVLLNFYGSTETTGDVTYEIVQNATDVAQKQYNGCVSLGTPIDCNKVYILDEEMKILPRGMTGEIAVSGVNVADSYINTKTSSNGSSNFVPNVFCSDKAHAVLYRIGDLGRIIDDRLYFEGRKDSQVKIRGKRVNLLEVENAIKRMPDVTAVVVLCATRSNASVPWDYEDKVPVAFVQMQDVDKAKSQEMIMDSCSKVLAAYMLPQVVVVDTLPLQSHTGKVDRQKLLEMYTSDICGSASPLGIIAQHLGINESLLDISKAFTDLGGSSLSAVSIVVALIKAGYRISLDSFLSAPSIEKILAILDLEPGSGGQSEDTSLFQTEMLHLCPDQEAAIDLLASAFAAKNPLDALAQSGVDSIKKGVNSILKEVLDDKLSIVVRNTATKDLTGVCININARTELFPEFDKEEVLAINEAVEGPVRVEVLQDGSQWIDSFLMAVSDKTDKKEAVKIIKLMETATYELGRERGFDGIITVNSHPLTAMVSEQEFGYTIKKSLHVKSYEFEGRHPFHQAHDDYYIHCMTKKIGHKKQK